MDPIRNANMSVKEVTVMDAPAEASALATRSSSPEPGSRCVSRSYALTTTNMSSTPTPRSRNGSTFMSGE